MEMNKELLAKAKETKTPEELMEFAKENNVEMTEESAKAYFDLIHPKTGELSEDELKNVSGGGCHADDGSCRRCRIYGDHRGMAGTVESAGDSAGYLFVQCAGKRKQRSSVFIRIVLGLRGCAAGNHPVLHSGM